MPHAVPMHLGMDPRARLLPALIGMLVWACAPAPGVAPSTTAPPPEPTTTTSLAAEEARGGQVVVGIADHGAPRTLNPFLDGPDTAVLDVLAPAIFATGYDIDPNTMEPVPDVLAEIPTLANGGLSPNPNGTMDVTVGVAPDARWADGTPITADDLAFTIETVLDPDLPIRADLRTRYGRIVPGSVRASGAELSFRMAMDASVELLFDVILPRHEVEGSDFAADWNERAWVSGGPFSVAEYRPGLYLDLVANPEYRKVDPGDGAALPRLDRLVIRFFEPGEDIDPRLESAFRAREIDVVLRSFPDGVAAGYEALESEGAEVVAAPGLEWELLAFQFGPGDRNPESLNRYARYRRAVAHAVDRDALAASRGTVPLYSTLRMYRPSLAAEPWAGYPPDPDETAGLLYVLGEEIGLDLFLGEGPRLVLSTSADNAAAVATAGETVVMLNEAGIGGELQLEDPALFYGQTLDNGTWDVAAWRFEAVPGRSGAIAFIRMFDPEGLPFLGYNFARWGTVDSLVQNAGTIRYAAIVDALDRTIDPAEIDALLAEAERILADQMVVLPLVVHDRVGAAVWADRVSGVEANPAQRELWNVEQWSLAGS